MFSENGGIENPAELERTLGKQNNIKKPLALEITAIQIRSVAKIFQ